jgi:F420-dependent oxidoreductase-like protein
MKLGLTVSNWTWPDAAEGIGPTFARIARDADDVGLASLWVMDHFFQIGSLGPPENEMLEGYAALAFAAGVTSRITLGTLVTGVSYRHPGLLVKAVTTLDVLSGGRAWLGIGAAWNQHEHRGLGVPFPFTGERFERLEETLQIAHQMWRDDDQPYEGRHFRLERPLNRPQPLTRPHPPILVGGIGERKTLRLVAQYADACNVFDMGPDKVRAKYDVIRRHCEEVGRDYHAIEKTVAARVDLSTESVDSVVDRLARLGEVGTQHVIVEMTGVERPGALDRVPELLAQLS